MKRYYAIFALFLFITTSCNKDNITPIEEEEISTPENWLAKQNVRILKVEKTNPNLMLLITGDSALSVEYEYDGNKNLKQIKTNSQNKIITYTFESENTSKVFRVNLDETYYQVRTLINANFNIENNMIKSVRNEYEYRLFSHSLGSVFRDAQFEYEKNGLLKGIKSRFEEFTDNAGTIISNISYASNEVISFQYSSNLVNDLTSIQLDNYEVKITYTKADEVPDGLKCMVNQALLGLTSGGYEEFLINPYLDFEPFDKDYAYPNYVKANFYDWLFSFGNNHLQTIPAQNTGIISSKNIIGLKTLRFNDEDEDGKNPYIKSNVDYTLSFPYIHDASAKTLEIAGLKIWYELVE